MKFSTAACLALLAVEVNAQGGLFKSLFGTADEKAADPAAATPLEHGKVPEDAPEAEHMVPSRTRATRQLNTGADDFDYSLAYPAQTFYIPLPETDVQEKMFLTINSNTNSAGDLYVRGDMVSIISVAISTDHTVLWYDHWEDSFEVDILNPISSDTQIWGDGDATNGCRPDFADYNGGGPCRDEDDVFMAGDSFVIQDSMPVPRTATGWMAHGVAYDGGDKVQASFPVTMTRGAYSEYPGSLLAGAVEILDTDSWGTSFEMPVGTNTWSETRSFEYTAAYIMSATNGNRVSLPDGSHTILNEGQSISLSITHGQKITSTDPVQVDIAAGDIDSNYELRWYSLLATSDWSNEYMTPVGDDYGKTKLIMYNPHSTSIQVKFEWLKSNGVMDSENYTIGAKSTKFTRVVPTDSGATVMSTGSSAGKDFIAFSMTDAANQSGAGNYGGRAFDWGFPVVPKNRLTPQVLVGWGYGCTDNDCTHNGSHKTERSAVWICPTEDADIYIDYKNQGSGYEKISLKKLESRKIRDTADTDMSGAIIFATQPDSGASGPPVDIAAAWGQDPSVSISLQQLSLDLGTVVLPFTTMNVKKVVDKANAVPGETLTYTISVQNVGQSELQAGVFTIHDPLMVGVKYVEASTKYSDDGGESWFTINDDATSTPFPLDEAGLVSQSDMARRGGMHLVRFEVVIDAETLKGTTLVNAGHVTPPIGSDLPFEAVTEVNMKATIDVENVVYIGDDGKNACNQAVEEVENVSGTVVTYCFSVTNTGPVYLDDIQLWNSRLGLKANDFDIPMLAPGDTRMVSATGKITGDFRNVVKVRGNPVYKNGNDIPGVGRPTAQDPSSVKMIEYSPQILIENTVYNEHKGTDHCAVAGVETALGPEDSPVTYCFKITNLGNTHLTNIVVTDPILGYTKTDYISLAPQESVVSSSPLTITETVENLATVTATPAMPDLVAIPNMVQVTNSDPSSVTKLVQGDPRTISISRPETCMQTNWEDAGNSQDLVCRAKEVTLKEVWTNRQSCQLNSMVKLDLMAKIHFNAARYDPGWYVALDGGDALVGNCALGALMQGTDYVVKENDKTVGHVAWNNDAKGGNDKCGDVFIEGGGGADIVVPFITDTEMKCVDNNDDGMMDFSVCFSWRTAGNDGKCTLSRDDPDTQGNQADLFPGTPSKCRCIRIDIPDVTVVKPDDDQHISPC